MQPMGLRSASLAVATSAFLFAGCGGGSSEGGGTAQAQTVPSSSGGSTASSGGGSSGSCIAIAPQLRVTGTEITATFLGASQVFGNLTIYGVGGGHGILFSSTTPIGTQFPLNSRDLSFTFTPGTDITASAGFGTDASSLSSTAASPSLVTTLTAPGPGIPGKTITFNAGVVQSGADSVQVGFNPPGMAQPSTLADFALRISLSNVNIASGGC
jgi:hypothetical protein